MLFRAKKMLFSNESWYQQINLIRYDYSSLTCYQQTSAEQMLLYSAELIRRCKVCEFWPFWLFIHSLHILHSWPKSWKETSNHWSRSNSHFLWCRMLFIVYLSLISNWGVNMGKKLDKLKKQIVRLLSGKADWRHCRPKMKQAQETLLKLKHNLLKWDMIIKLNLMIISHLSISRGRIILSNIRLG